MPEADAMRFDRASSLDWASARASFSLDNLKDSDHHIIGPGRGQTGASRPARIATSVILAGWGFQWGHDDFLADVRGRCSAARMRSCRSAVRSEVQVGP